MLLLLTWLRMMSYILPCWKRGGGMDCSAVSGSGSCWELSLGSQGLLVNSLGGYDEEEMSVKGGGGLVI